ncbi:MAG: hypothetical protein ACP5IC_02525 [Minisyncoccia bacterium]
MGNFKYKYDITLIMVEFKKYIKYIYPLLEQKYVVEVLNNKKIERETLSIHDLTKYFDLIAIREGDVRLIKIMNKIKEEIFVEIKSVFNFNEPSIEVWYFRKTKNKNNVEKKIYKLINGQFYRIMYDINYLDCRNVKKIMKYKLWGEEGILVIGGYNAYFIKNREVLDNFDKNIKPNLTEKTRVVYQNNKLILAKVGNKVLENE